MVGARWSAPAARFCLSFEGECFTGFRSKTSEMSSPSHCLFENWDLLDRLAGRRFRDEALALEAVQYVLDALRRDEWARVHRGPISPP
jgi:hypothetical protein